MAIELMSRIQSQPRSALDASEKWVLTVMADRADDDGLLWYAVGTIAERTSYTPRAVQKIIDRLIKKGLVKKLHRQDRSNYYVIQVDRLAFVERKKRPKEQGPIEFVAPLDAEPDLFSTGEPGSGGTGERRSSTGEPGSGTGESGSPYSLNDSLSDSLNPDAHARGGRETLEAYIVRRWNGLAVRFDKLAPFRAEITESRRKSIALRTKEYRGNTRVLLHRTPVSSPDDHPQDAETAVWDFVFDVIAGSKLLTGQKLDWAPNFDWMLGPKNMGKIMGGHYGHGHDRIDAIATNERSAVAAGSAARELVERARGTAGPRAGNSRGPGKRTAGAGR